MLCKGFVFRKHAWEHGLPTPVRSFNVGVSMLSGLGTRLARNELCVGGARTLVLAVTSERGENHTGICIYTSGSATHSVLERQSRGDGTTVEEPKRCDEN